MGKRIHHMGLVMEQGTHEDFHERAPELNASQHEALMKRLGITSAEDTAWHKIHLTLAEQRTLGLKRVDPRIIGTAFCEFCLRQYWMVQRRGEYFANKKGIDELRSRFDIAL